MTACNPLPADGGYSLGENCGATTFPYDPGVSLAVTGFEPLVFVVVVLSLCLLGALSFAIAAVWSARGSQITAKEALDERDSAETELANHLARHPASPESVADRQLMHKQGDGYFGSLDPRIERPEVSP